MKKEYYGACRYCGQQTLIQIGDDVAKQMIANGGEYAMETYLKDQATFACNCEGARAYTNVEKRIEKAEERCIRIAPSDEVAEIMQQAVRPLMMEKIDKLIIKSGVDTYSLYIDGDDRIHVRKEFKQVDDETN